MSDKVIAGPAGHWYALFSDPQYGDTLIGLPMSSEDSGLPHHRNDPPPHPGDDVEALIDAGWYEITDPLPLIECGICGAYHPEGFTGDCRDDENRYADDRYDQALIAELKS